MISIKRDFFLVVFFCILNNCLHALQYYTKCLTSIYAQSHTFKMKDVNCRYVLPRHTFYFLISL